MHIAGSFWKEHLGCQALGVSREERHISVTAYLAPSKDRVKNAFGQAEPWRQR